MIPFEAAPKDPEWLLKAYAKEKLNALEMEEYLRYSFEKEHQKRLVQDCPANKKIRSDLRRPGVWAGVPPLGLIKDAVLKHESVKRSYKKCMAS